MSKQGKDYTLNDLASLSRRDPRKAEVVRSLGHRLERVIESMQSAADDQELLSVARQEYLKLGGTTEEFDMLVQATHQKARSQAAGILGRYLRLSTNTIIRYFGRRSVTVQRAAGTRSSIAASTRAVAALKQSQGVLVWGPSSRELDVICNLAAIEFTGDSDRVFAIDALLMIEDPLLERRRRMQEMMGLTPEMDTLPAQVQNLLARALADRGGLFVLYIARVPVIEDLKILFRRLPESLKGSAGRGSEALKSLLSLLPPNLHILASMQAETDNGFPEWAGGFVIVH